MSAGKQKEEKKIAVSCFFVHAKKKNLFDFEHNLINIHTPEDKLINFDLIIFELFKNIFPLFIHIRHAM